MNRTVTATALLALVLLMGGCAATNGGDSTARNEAGLGDQDLGPTHYDPRYPSDDVDDGKDEDARRIDPPALESGRADG
ncbi:MAG: hypothetical protein ACYTG4_08325 [Planctomycetota bacterium]|jgi:hypothetical protein